MTDPRMIVEQLLVLRGAEVRTFAKSEGVSLQQEEWVWQAAMKLGELPPPAGFASTFVSRVKDFVLVARAELHDAGLLMRFLIVPREAYESWPDPFRWTEFYPVDWSARGRLPVVQWTPKLVQVRDVQALRNLLKSSDSVLLLGATQALLDGGRVLLCGADAKPEYVEQIWMLLPDASRCEILPASWSPDPLARFDVMTSSITPEPWPEGTLSAEQARDYPEGRYELALQIAIEAGDQLSFNRLIARRSSRQTFKLVVMMIVLMLMITFALKFIA